MAVLLLSALFFDAAGGGPSPLATHPGWTARLVAQEPQVVDPVAVRWDAGEPGQGGRLWVVEMPDYPTGPPDGAAPRGRVRVLSDEDRDGTFETAATFAEGLDQPTGVQPWRTGCLVTLAGELAYLPDDDRDGRADGKEVWLTGLSTGNEQLRPNHPTLAPDGWLYVANGLRTDAVTDPRTGTSVSVRGRDVRLDPLRPGVVEAASGHGQHGLSFDPWGRRFVCSNARPLDHAVLPAAALAANPHLRSAGAVAAVIPGGQGRPVYPLVEQWTTSVVHAGSFTAACGLLIREGRHGVEALVCEPTGSLVHRERLTPAGSTFDAAPDRGGVEFLASTDPWFRPVDLTAGPGGSVFVADFCRAVIEHPEWMTPEAETRADFEGGRDRGRIYQLVPDAPSPAEDVSDLAFRRVLELGNAFNARSLEPTTAAGRLRRLHLIKRTGGLTDDDWAAALADPEAVVRERAVRLWDRAGAPDSLADVVVSLADDADAMVRTRAAVALRRVASGDAAAALAGIADGGDEWARRAVLAASAGRAAEVLDAFAGEDRDLRRELSRLTVIEADDPAAVATDSLANASTAEATGLVEGLRERGVPLGEVTLPDSFEGLTGTAAAAGDPAAVALVADFAADAEEILSLTNHASPAARAAAWAGLSRRADLPLPESVVASLSSRPPGERASLTAALLSGPSRTLRLLRAVEAGDVPADAVDGVTADRLRSHRDEAVRSLAEAVLPDRAADVAGLLAEYRPSLGGDRDAARGRGLFAEHCGVCHRVGESGGAVGPDLSDLRTKDREALLLAVLAPDAAVDARYAAYSVVTSAGRVLSGVLVGETAAAVTLRGADGRDVTVPRNEIEQLHASGRSLMPSGFERRLDPPAMADVIEYLKTWRFLAADAAAEE